MKGIAEDELHFVLPEFGDESIADSGGLQRVDGFREIEFEAAPQQGAGLALSDEDGEWARPGGGFGALAGGGGHDAPPTIRSSAAPSGVAGRPWGSRSTARRR